MQPASDHYRVDPLEGETASLTPEEQARILGGEACTWTENIDDQNIDAADWPRRRWKAMWRGNSPRGSRLGKTIRMRFASN